MALQVQMLLEATLDQARSYPCIPSDHENPAAHVRIVADEVEVRLIGTHDTVAALTESARIQVNRVAEHPQLGAEARGEDHLVDRLLRSIRESDPALRECGDIALDRDR